MYSYIRNFFHGNQRSVAVKKNIIGSLAIKGCSIIISLLLVPMTLGYVSSELYGIWLTLSSIMIWLNFFDIGFTLGLKNKLTEAIAINDWKRGKALVSTTYFMMVAIFIPLLVVLELVIPCINWAKFLNVSLQYNEDIIKALYVLAGCFCLQMIVNVLTAVVAAFQKVALSSLFPVIGNFLSLIAIYILTKCCPPSLVSLAYAIAMMPIIVIAFASVILYNGKFKDVSPNIKSIDTSYVKDLFSLGFKFFIIQLQVVILYQSTNVLISNVSSPEDVTNYNIAYKYLGIAMMLYTIILSPIWPAFTDAYAKKDFAWMKNIYRKMAKIYFFSAIALVIMIAVSPLVYHVWVGDKVSVPFLMTVAVGLYMMIHSWDSLQVNMINGIGTVQLQTYIVILGSIIHIPLSLFLGKYIGALGVVCSMIVVNAIYSTCFTMQIHKILNRSASGIWLK